MKNKMETLSQYLKALDQEIDINKLPEVARRELAIFYEFLVFKYLGQQDKIKNNQEQILTAIFQETKGKLPENYTFNRDELRER
jgi:hypothetical protein